MSDYFDADWDRAVMTRIEGDTSLRITKKSYMRFLQATVFKIGQNAGCYLFRHYDYNEMTSDVSDLHFAAYFYRPTQETIDILTDTERSLCNDFSAVWQGWDRKDARNNLFVIEATFSLDNAFDFAMQSHLFWTDYVYQTNLGPWEENNELMTRAYNNAHGGKLIDPFYYDLEYRNMSEVFSACAKLVGYGMTTRVDDFGGRSVYQGPVCDDE